MNTPTKTSQMSAPGAPVKDMSYRSPMPTTYTRTAPGAPKKSLAQTAQAAASGAYKSITTNLFGSKPSTGGKKHRSARRSRSAKKYPKKGMASKTRKGRKDYVTHKGNKFYNRKGKRQTKSRKGRKGKPYSRRARK
jgi:hypothetical protein